MPHSIGYTQFNSFTTRVRDWMKKQAKLERKQQRLDAKLGPLGKSVLALQPAVGGDQATVHNAEALLAKVAELEHRLQVNEVRPLSHICSKCGSIDSWLSFPHEWLSNPMFQKALQTSIAIARKYQQH
jgi:hypothetical protein